MHRNVIALSSAVTLTTALSSVSAFAASAATAVRVCVEVVPKTWKEAPAGKAPLPLRPATATPAPSPAPAAAAASGASPAAPTSEAPASPRAPGAPPSPLAPGAPQFPPYMINMADDPSIAQQGAASRGAGTSTKASVRSGEDDQQVRPELYLKRLLEYEVTHDEAYDAVKDGCRERMTVELYELRDGWTVFGRFSRYAREEKIDHVKLDEFAALAERMATALLHDRSIDQTITRHNVLRDDSEVATRSVSGSSFVQFGLGTSARVGILPTAATDVRDAVPESKVRLLTPLAFTAGYRGKFRTWGLEAFARLYVGTTQRAANSNLRGGHTDYSGGGALGLHFLRYADSEAMNSIYFGGGASFELQRFATIVSNAEVQAGNESRRGLWTGGLDLDLVLGYEFMRASSVHFYTQLDVNLPLYVLESENESGRIHTYMPGAQGQIGILF